MLLRQFAWLVESAWIIMSKCVYYPRSERQHNMDTEYLDHLYLEIAQFTGAKTYREIRLERIAEAADELEDWLGKNSGDSADWPIRIKGDEDSAIKAASLLSALKNALQPYRDAKMILTAPK